MRVLENKMFTQLIIDILFHECQKQIQCNYDFITQSENR